MTEADWDRCTDPQPMLESLRDSVTLTERKGRLFVVACCRRVWPFLADERSRQAVEEAERHAEGLVSTDALHRACKLAVDARGRAPSRFTAAAVEAVDPALRARRSWERAARAVEREDGPGLGDGDRQAVGAASGPGRLLSAHAEGASAPLVGPALHAAGPRARGRGAWQAPPTPKPGSALLG